MDLLVTGLSSKSHSCVGGGTAANWQSNIASSFLVTMRSCGTTTAWGKLSSATAETAGG